MQFFQCLVRQWALRESSSFRPDALQPRFHTTQQAQSAINVWLKQYNQVRPYHALNMRPPAPETLLEKSKITGTEIGG
ncbi:integrase core domain-containing protein [uncultured Shimia sp.]|uniref:integrase core domain-containing protein n=1 Tax=uncultured Shimia sp. TaxID=573152 RepID=UPI003438C8E3